MNYVNLNQGAFEIFVGLVMSTGINIEDSLKSSKIVVCLIEP